MSLTIIYRISDNGHTAGKFSFATKLYCLSNFLYASAPYTKMIRRIHILIDNTNLKKETLEGINNLTSKFPDIESHLYHGGSSAQSWVRSYEYFLDLKLGEDDAVLFQEDDYLYLTGFPHIILEGLNRGVHYIAPYLHGDRFIPKSKGGNPFVDDSASFATRFFKTDNRFWVQVESTTMTFATTSRTIKEDGEIWKEYTMKGTYPRDFEAFLALTRKGRTIASPVPTLSTHCMEQWKSPLIGTCYTDWRQI